MPRPWTGASVTSRPPKRIRPPCSRSRPALGERKAGQCDVEFEIEGLQLDRKQLMIPPGIQGELVVGDDIGPALVRIEV